MKNIKYQKTIIVTTFLISLVALFGFVPNNFAIGYYEQTLQPAPLQVEVTPSQSWLNEQTRNNLIATYGISLFNSCSKSEKRCTSSMNSYEYASCLRFVQLDLAQGIMDGCHASKNQQNVSNNVTNVTETPCNNRHAYPTGEYGLKTAKSLDSLCCHEDWVFSNNKQCVTKAQSCKDNFGNNSIWNGNIDKDGDIVCGCAQGFIWNSKFTACIAQTPSGTLCNGKYWNDCPAGESFYCPSTGDAQCKKSQELPTPISITNDTSDTSPKIQETVIENDPIKNLPEQKGVFSKIWVWLAGLFGS